MPLKVGCATTLHQTTAQSGTGLRVFSPQSEPELGPEPLPFPAPSALGS